MISNLKKLLTPWFLLAWVVILTGCAGLINASPSTPLPLAQMPKMSDSTPFDDAFKVIARVAHNGVVVYLDFPDQCFLCRKRDLAIDDVMSMAKARKLSIETSQKISKLLTSRSSYFVGVNKPCPPIYPTGALLIENMNSRILLLFFSSCKTLRLVTDDRVDYSILNIDPISEYLFSLTKEDEK